MSEQMTAEWIRAQAGKWCSWTSAVHTRLDGRPHTYDRPVYGIILPDDESSRDEGVFCVLELEPGAVTYDVFVKPEEITILDDIPRVFPAGYSSLNHPAETEVTDAQKRAYRTILHVEKVAGLLDQMSEDNGRLADSLSSEYSKGKHDAYANAAKFIRELIGDSDE